MKVARAVLAAVGFGCLLVAFAGKGKIGIPEYLMFDVPATDTPGRIGLTVLGVGIYAAIAIQWWLSRKPAAVAATLAPQTLVRKSLVTAAQVVTVHYHRPDGRYDDWRLYYFGDGVAAEDRVNWPGRRWDGVDGFGAKWDVKVADPALPLGLEVHRGKKKDPYGPVMIDPIRHGAVYLASGRPGVHPSPAAALNTPLQEREIVLHYHRPSGDYDGWTLWCYDGPADPPLHWEESLQPEPYRDEIGGIVFRVPLAAGAPGMKLILHNEDVKDHPPNGLELRVDTDGLEIWVEQGKLGKFRPAPP